MEGITPGDIFYIAILGGVLLWAYHMLRPYM
jgi:hypothetical protein